MYKFNKLILVLFLVALLALPAFAAVLTSCTGAPDSSGNCPIAVDSDRMITTNGGVYAKYELATTSDTLTAAESGKVIIVENVTGLPATFILPDADVGLTYTFVNGGTTTAAGAGQRIYVDPQSTDYIFGLNGALANTFAAGDKIYSAGNTGDSVTVTCYKDLYWQATQMRGTWSDGG